MNLNSGQLAKTLNATLTSFDRCHSSPSENNEQQTTQITEYKKLGLKTFEYTEHKLQDMDNDIDPENNFINNNCCYYTDDQFNMKVKSDHKMSIIHFNRSRP